MELSIQFVEQALPSAQNHASSQGAIGGVVRLRSREQTRGYKRSIDFGKPGELEDAEDEDAGLRNEADYKHSQVCTAASLVLQKWLRLTQQLQSFSIAQVVALAYQSIGVIYGDIGTSPLYVFSSTFTEAPSHIDLLGALSLVLWAITLMVTIKYIVIVLRADNDGEGGTFSTYSLLSRYVSPPATFSLSMDH